MPDAIHEQCISAVKTVIQGLDLDGIPDAQIYDRKLIIDRELTLPCVIISPEGVEQDLGGTNERDDWGYPVPLVYVDADNQDLADTALKRKRMLLWRQRLRRAFHNKRLSAVSEVYVCRVEPNVIIDQTAWLERNKVVGGMTIRCVTREVRT